MTMKPHLPCPDTPQRRLTSRRKDRKSIENYLKSKYPDSTFENFKFVDSDEKDGVGRKTVVAEHEDAQANDLTSGKYSHCSSPVESGKTNPGKPVRQPSTKLSQPEADVRLRGRRKKVVTTEPRNVCDSISSLPSTSSRLKAKAHSVDEQSPRIMKVGQGSTVKKSQGDSKNPKPSYLNNVTPEIGVVPKKKRGRPRKVITEPKSVCVPSSPVPAIPIGVQAGDNKLNTPVVERSHRSLVKSSQEDSKNPEPLHPTNVTPETSIVPKKKIGRPKKVITELKSVQATDNKQDTLVVELSHSSLVKNSQEDSKNLEPSHPTNVTPETSIVPKKKIGRPKKVITEPKSVQATDNKQDTLVVELSHSSLVKNSQEDSKNLEPSHPTNVIPETSIVPKKKIGRPKKVITEPCVPSYPLSSIPKSVQAADVKQNALVEELRHRSPLKNSQGDSTNSEPSHSTNVALSEIGFGRENNRRRRKNDTEPQNPLNCQIPVIYSCSDSEKAVNFKLPAVRLNRIKYELYDHIEKHGFISVSRFMSEMGLTSYVAQSKTLTIHSEEQTIPSACEDQLKVISSKYPVALSDGTAHDDLCETLGNGKESKRFLVFSSPEEDSPATYITKDRSAKQYDKQTIEETIISSCKGSLRTNKSGCEPAKNIISNGAKRLGFEAHDFRIAEQCVKSKTVGRKSSKSQLTLVRQSPRKHWNSILAKRPENMFNKLRSPWESKKVVKKSATKQPAVKLADVVQILDSDDEDNSYPMPVIMQPVVLQPIVMKRVIMKQLVMRNVSHQQPCQSLQLVPANMIPPNTNSVLKNVGQENRDDETILIPSSDESLDSSDSENERMVQSLIEKENDYSELQGICYISEETRRNDPSNTELEDCCFVSGKTKLDAPSNRMDLTKKTDNLLEQQGPTSSAAALVNTAIILGTASECDQGSSNREESVSTTENLLSSPHDESNNSIRKEPIRPRALNDFVEDKHLEPNHCGTNRVESSTPNKMLSTSLTELVENIETVDMPSNEMPSKEDNSTSEQPEVPSIPEKFVVDSCLEEHSSLNDTTEQIGNLNLPGDISCSHVKSIDGVILEGISSSPCETSSNKEIQNSIYEVTACEPSLIGSSCEMATDDQADGLMSDEHMSSSTVQSVETVLPSERSKEVQSLEITPEVFVQKPLFVEDSRGSICALPSDQNNLNQLDGFNSVENYHITPAAPIEDMDSLKPSTASPSNQNDETNQEDKINSVGDHHVTPTSPVEDMGSLEPSTISPSNQNDGFNFIQNHRVTPAATIEGMDSLGRTDRNSVIEISLDGTNTDVQIQSDKPDEFVERSPCNEEGKELNSKLASDYNDPNALDEALNVVENLLVSIVNTVENMIGLERTSEISIFPSNGETLEERCQSGCPPVSVEKRSHADKSIESTSKLSADNNVLTNFENCSIQDESCSVTSADLIRNMEVLGGVQKELLLTSASKLPDKQLPLGEKSHETYSTLSLDDNEIRYQEKSSTSDTNQLTSFSVENMEAPEEAKRNQHQPYGTIVSLEEQSHNESGSSCSESPFILKDVSVPNSAVSPAVDGTILQPGENLNGLSTIKSIERMGLFQEVEKDRPHLCKLSAKEALLAEDSTEPCCESPLVRNDVIGALGGMENNLLLQRCEFEPSVKEPSHVEVCSDSCIDLPLVLSDIACNENILDTVVKQSISSVKSSENFDSSVISTENVEPLEGAEKDRLLQSCAAESSFEEPSFIEKCTEPCSKSSLISNAVVNQSFSPAESCGIPNTISTVEFVQTLEALHGAKKDQLLESEISVEKGLLNLGTELCSKLPLIHSDTEITNQDIESTPVMNHIVSSTESSENLMTHEETNSYVFKKIAESEEKREVQSQKGIFGVFSQNSRDSFSELCSDHHDSKSKDGGSYSNENRTMSSPGSIENMERLENASGSSLGKMSPIRSTKVSSNDGIDVEEIAKSTLEVIIVKHSDEMSQDCDGDSPLDQIEHQNENLAHVEPQSASPIESCENHNAEGGIVDQISVNGGNITESEFCISLEGNQSRTPDVSRSLDDVNQESSTKPFSFSSMAETTQRAGAIPGQRPLITSKSTEKLPLLVNELDLLSQTSTNHDFAKEGHTLPNQQSKLSSFGSKSSLSELCGVSFQQALDGVESTNLEEHFITETTFPHIDKSLEDFYAKCSQGNASADFLEMSEYTEALVDACLRENLPESSEDCLPSMSVVESTDFPSASPTNAFVGGSVRDSGHLAESGAIADLPEEFATECFDLQQLPITSSSTGLGDHNVSNQPICSSSELIFDGHFYDSDEPINLPSDGDLNKLCQLGTVPDELQSSSIHGSPYENDYDMNSNSHHKSLNITDQRTKVSTKLSSKPASNLTQPGDINLSFELRQPALPCEIADRNVCNVNDSTGKKCDLGEEISFSLLNRGVSLTVVPQDPETVDLCDETAPKRKQIDTGRKVNDLLFDEEFEPCNNLTPVKRTRVVKRMSPCRTIPEGSILYDEEFESSSNFIPMKKFKASTRDQVTVSRVYTRTSSDLLFDEEFEQSNNVTPIKERVSGMDRSQTASPQAVRLTALGPVNELVIDDNDDLPLNGIREPVIDIHERAVSRTAEGCVVISSDEESETPVVNPGPDHINSARPINRPMIQLSNKTNCVLQHRPVGGMPKRDPIAISSPIKVGRSNGRNPSPKQMTAFSPILEDVCVDLSETESETELAEMPLIKKSIYVPKCVVSPPRKIRILSMDNEETSDLQTPKQVASRLNALNCSGEEYVSGEEKCSSQGTSERQSDRYWSHCAPIDSNKVSPIGMGATDSEIDSVDFKIRKPRPSPTEISNTSHFAPEMSSTPRCSPVPAPVELPEVTKDAIYTDDIIELSDSDTENARTSVAVNITNKMQYGGRELSTDFLDEFIESSDSSMVDNYERNPLPTKPLSTQIQDLIQNYSGQLVEQAETRYQKKGTSHLEKSSTESRPTHKKALVIVVPSSKCSDQMSESNFIECGDGISSGQEKAFSTSTNHSVSRQTFSHRQKSTAWNVQIQRLAGEVVGPSARDASIHDKCEDVVGNEDRLMPPKLSLSKLSLTSQSPTVLAKRIVIHQNSTALPSLSKERLAKISVGVPAEGKSAYGSGSNVRNDSSIIRLTEVLPSKLTETLHQKKRTSLLRKSSTESNPTHKEALVVSDGECSGQEKTSSTSPSQSVSKQILSHSQKSAARTLIVTREIVGLSGSSPVAMEVVGPSGSRSSLDTSIHNKRDTIVGSSIRIMSPKLSASKPPSASQLPTGLTKLTVIRQNSIPSKTVPPSSLSNEPPLARICVGVPVEGKSGYDSGSNVSGATSHITSAEVLPSKLAETLYQKKGTSESRKLSAESHPTHKEALAVSDGEYSDTMSVGDFIESEDGNCTGKEKASSTSPNHSPTGQTHSPSQESTTLTPQTLIVVSSEVVGSSGSKPVLNTSVSNKCDNIVDSANRFMAPKMSLSKLPSASQTPTGFTKLIVIRQKAPSLSVSKERPSARIFVGVPVDGKSGHGSGSNVSNATSSITSAEVLPSKLAETICRSKGTSQSRKSSTGSQPIHKKALLVSDGEYSDAMSLGDFIESDDGVPSGQEKASSTSSNHSASRQTLSHSQKSTPLTPQTLIVVSREDVGPSSSRLDLDTSDNNKCEAIVESSNRFMSPKPSSSKPPSPVQSPTVLRKRKFMRQNSTSTKAAPSQIEEQPPARTFVGVPVEDESWDYEGSEVSSDKSGITSAEVLTLKSSFSTRLLAPLTESSTSNLKRTSTAYISKPTANETCFSSVTRSKANDIKYSLKRKRDRLSSSSKMSSSETGPSNRIEEVFVERSPMGKHSWKEFTKPPTNPELEAKIQEKIASILQIKKKPANAELRSPATSKRVRKTSTRNIDRVNKNCLTDLEDVGDSSATTPDALSSKLVLSKKPSNFKGSGTQKKEQPGSRRSGAPNTKDTSSAQGRPPHGFSQPPLKKKAIS